MWAHAAVGAVVVPKRDVQQSQHGPLHHHGGGVRACALRGTPPRAADEESGGSAFLLQGAGALARCAQPKKAERALCVLVGGKGASARRGRIAREDATREAVPGAAPNAPNQNEGAVYLRWRGGGARRRVAHGDTCCEDARHGSARPGGYSIVMKGYGERRRHTHLIPLDMASSRGSVRGRDARARRMGGGVPGLCCSRRCWPRSRRAYLVGG